MSATHLVLDIETIPDPELPRIEENERIPPPPHNQIVTIGCMLLEDYVPTRLGVVGESGSEGQMLADFGKWLDAKRPTVVTWNGRGFDMPVITSRALKHGVPMPWWFSDRNTRYRYSSEGHFDLMDFLADFGAAKSARLDAYAKLVGFPGKVGVDGSQVLPMVHAGKLDEVNAYCLCDVAQTAAIFLRVELLRGNVDRLRYCELARGMLTFIDAHARLGAIAGRIDRESFTLGELVAPLPAQVPLDLVQRATHEGSSHNSPDFLQGVGPTPSPTRSRDSEHAPSLDSEPAPASASAPEIPRS